MTRAGRILGAIATVLSSTFVVGALGTAGGCSGSEGTLPQAERDEAADKVAQDKMREYMKNQGPQGKLLKRTH